MPRCTIIQGGIHTTIQDKGRHGLAHFAIPPSGYMDKQAADLANLLVGNAEGGAVIECALSGPTIRFEDEAVIALTGSEMQWTVDGVAVGMYQTLRIAKGSVLKSRYSKEGLYGYIAIAGSLSTTYDHGSCAAYAPARMGHLGGQALRKGDVIEWADPSKKQPTIKVAARSVSTEISIIPGPEYQLLSAEAKERLIQGTFTKSLQSNRMGARLVGQSLQTNGVLKGSVPVFPGMIQLPPSGEPIVVLQDGQTTGGYPRIGIITDEAVDDFCQIPFKKGFRFKLS